MTTDSDPRLRELAAQMKAERKRWNADPTEETGRRILALQDAEYRRYLELTHADLEKAKADSTRKATAAADSLKKLKVRVDSLTKANAAVPDSIKLPFDSLTVRAKADSVVKAKADSTAKAKADSLKAKGDSARKDEKPGYKPDHLRMKVEAPRDLPKGTVVLRGGRAVTMTARTCRSTSSSA